MKNPARTFGDALRKKLKELGLDNPVATRSVDMSDLARARPVYAKIRCEVPLTNDQIIAIAAFGQDFNAQNPGARFIINIWGKAYPFGALPSKMAEALAAPVTA